jgi:hypothetical protein
MTIQILIGFIFAILGIVIIKYGDRDITEGNHRGGIILKIFSHSYLNPKILKWQRKFTKWALGLAAVCFGIYLIVDVVSQTLI